MPSVIVPRAFYDRYGATESLRSSNVDPSAVESISVHYQGNTATVDYRSKQKRQRHSAEIYSF